MTAMTCFKSKTKAKTVAKNRRAKGKRAHIKAKKGGFCVVASKAKKVQKSAKK